MVGVAKGPADALAVADDSGRSVGCEVLSAVGTASCVGTADRINVGIAEKDGCALLFPAVTDSVGITAACACGDCTVMNCLSNRLRTSTLYKLIPKRIIIIPLKNPIIIAFRLLSRCMISPSPDDPNLVVSLFFGSPHTIHASRINVERRNDTKY